MVDRQNAHGRVVAPHTMSAYDIHAGRHQVAVAEYHALGVAGGAGCVHQKARRIGLGCGTRRGGKCVILRPVRTVVGVETYHLYLVVDGGNGLVDHLPVVVRTQNHPDF